MLRQRLVRPEPDYYAHPLAQCQNCERLYPPQESSGHSSGFCVICTVDALRRDYLYEIEK